VLRVAASAALTVIPAVAAGTVTAHASAAAAAAAASSRGGVSLAIDSVSPQVAAPGKTIVVTGTVTNATGTTVSGLSVQLDSSPAAFLARDTMESYANGDQNVSVAQEGNPDLIANVRPGGTVTWRARFTAADAGYAQFGVYPLQAVLTDDLSGTQITSRQTLLPYWPGNDQGIAKLKIAWIWPLIDAPRRQACQTLTDNGLATSVASGGRLANLLAAGTANQQADLTWAIDPALLSDVSTITREYSIQGPNWTPSDCKGRIAEPRSTAAAAWLRTLKSATATQPVITTPYANADVAALTHHQGMYAELTSAYSLGQQVSTEVLGRSFGTSFALPPGGLADQSVLTTLATTEHVSSVVLDSRQMPPVDAQGYADDAVTSFRTMAGQDMNVLLADNSITGLLQAAKPGQTASEQFGLAQQFLAETAMIASELPDSHRSVVISPPETWAPSTALASKLLQESSSEPWLQPVTLTSLAGSHDSESKVARQNPPSAKASPKELSGSYLSQVSGLNTDLSLYKSLLYQAPPDYVTGLTEALAATTSAAWRGSPGAAAQGEGLIADLTANLQHNLSRVKIEKPPEITMAGSSGQLPVTIQNELEQSVRVRLAATVPVASGDGPSLVFRRVADPIILKPGQTAVEKPYVSSAPSGTTNIQLFLTTTDGRALPQSDGASLSVHSTRYGQDILILIAGAIGLLVLSSLWRSGRRSMAGRPPDRLEPGNVMGGAKNPTEAPDDLADARRWADDT